ncbi:2Fe-2S iron-sulfur cluster binding domain-containing protein [Paracoccus alcaliphilus]|uniref:2Fe-2S iron-sulfur cluster binding domain-containing protein n=1 Tax=Paracoccus alcaliphilus TaxID=34002 RepID=A0A1H8P1H3_9RHOB|nr:(2Fe-2S)-binding protein [Paracoccus sp. AS002]SEO35463.1 2Fe-2S iron-sulfur cluster binding domain-containing protein [Paracoccus alcaliphilus]
MTTETLFSIPASAGQKMVRIEFEGETFQVPEGISVAAALLSNGRGAFRTSIVGGAPRAPYCMMGICFECLVEIDGIPARQGCMTPVRNGMIIRRQPGAPSLKALASGGRNEH